MAEYTTSDAHADAADPPSVLDKLLRAASLGGVAVLLILVGSIATVGGYFPGPQVGRAYEGGRALYDKVMRHRNIYQTDLWPLERRPDRGVTVYQPGLAQDGATLYTSGSEPAAYLIDMNGNVLHKWHRPFSTVWTADAGGVAEPQPDTHVYFRQARLLPDGKLIALYEAAGDTPYGYGVVLLDRDSQVIWSYFGHAHHQLDVGPDGRIYVLTHEFVDDELERLAHLARPRLEDFLVILSPEGLELDKIRLLPSLSASPYAPVIYTMSAFSLADPLHANSVKYIDRDDAAGFAFGEEGQLLLSFRETSALAVLDPETRNFVWATRGAWIGQHDPDILPDGNILLFDNFGNYENAQGRSRVIEFDPVTMEVVWQYAGTTDSPLTSNIRSEQQRLANGNTLITESDGGRIVEVTPDGEIAWEFLNPVRGGPQGNQIPIIGWAERLDASSLDPDLASPHARHDRQETETSL
jgi:hypothetical protein